MTLEIYLMGRDKAYPLTPYQLENAKITVERLNELEKAYGSTLVLTSGYRPSKITFTIPGAKAGDAHEKCCGADLRDHDLKLSKWCMANLDILEKVGLWLEHPDSSENHCHLQTIPPKSRRRVFIA